MRPVVLVLRLPHKIDPALRPALRYLGALDSEIDTVGSLLDPSIRVGPVHFDGGSPPMLKREGTV